MDRRSSFLSSVLGQDSAQALAKVAERCAPLGSALLPRAVVAWVGSVPQFEGTIPGIENSYVRFTKSALGYSGTINIREQNYEFEGATQEHVASAVIVALGLDTAQIAAGAREIDLARLGKSIDLLVRARAATALLKAQVQFAKIKLPGVKITKSEMVHACGDCGTRFLSAAGTLRGCLCVRDLLKHVEIEDEQVQLGVIVCRTHRESGLTFKEWNDLPCLDREARLAATIYAMREEKEKARAR